MQYILQYKYLHPWFGCPTWDFCALMRGCLCCNLNPCVSPVRSWRSHTLTAKFRCLRMHDQRGRANLCGGNRWAAAGGAYSGGHGTGV